MHPDEATGKLNTTPAMTVHPVRPRDEEKGLKVGDEQRETNRTLLAAYLLEG